MPRFCRHEFTGTLTSLCLGARLRPKNLVADLPQALPTVVVASPKGLRSVGQVVVRQQPPHARSDLAEPVPREQREQVVLELVLQAAVEPVLQRRTRDVHRRRRLVAQEPPLARAPLLAHGGGEVRDVQLQVEHGAHEVRDEPHQGPLARRREPPEQQKVPREVESDAGRVDRPPGRGRDGYEVQVEAREEDAQGEVRPRLELETQPLQRAAFPGPELLRVDEDEGVRAGRGVVRQHVREGVVGEVVAPPPRGADAADHAPQRPPEPERGAPPAQHRPVQNVVRRQQALLLEYAQGDRAGRLERRRGFAEEAERGERREPESPGRGRDHVPALDAEEPPVPHEGPEFAQFRVAVGPLAGREAADLEPGEEGAHGRRVKRRELVRAVLAAESFEQAGAPGVSRGPLRHVENPAFHDDPEVAGRPVRGDLLGREDARDHVRPGAARSFAKISRRRVDRDETLRL